MSLPEQPITRGDHYLAYIAGQNVQLPNAPWSREDEYLDYIVRHGMRGSVLDVYYSAGHIYEDPEMTTEITPIEGRVYYAINANMLYVYINEAFKALSGGATNPSVVYDSYQEMVAAVNDMTSEDLVISSNIYIRNPDIPDLWVSTVEETSVPYVYTTDAAIVNELKTNHYIRVGYFKIAQLESGASIGDVYTKSETDAKFQTKAGMLEEATITLYEVGSNTPHTYKTYIEAQ